MRAEIEILPVAGALGAEVRGLDLAAPIAPETAARLRQALTDHLVLFFRDQRLTPEQQKTFSRIFGPLERVPYVGHLPEHPEIIAVLKEADERGISTFGGSWHTDFSFLPEPPLGSVLYALEVPDHGGDTLWANQYLAYETLSPGLRRLLDGLVAMHSGRIYGSGLPAGLKTSRSIAISRNNPEADAETPHPAVRLHPQSGRKALFVNPVYTTRFEDMTEAESRPLLEFLWAQATRPEFTCRFRWTNGAVAVWDNRCTQHLAINDYDGRRRLLHRTTIAGERPVPAA